MREDIFLALIAELAKLNDKQIKDVADSARVHWTTLYRWLQEDGTMNPHINTLCRVAPFLGYELFLRRNRVAQLKRAA